MNQDKARYVIKKVGLCWHEYKKIKGLFICKCGKPYNPPKIGASDTNQLDPSTPAGMYGEGGVWKAFKTNENINGLQDFLLERGVVQSGCYPTISEFMHLFASPPDLFNALYEYFKSKEGE